MNIKGLLLLKSLGLPEGFIHIKKFSEISPKQLDSLNKEKSLLLIGSDERVKINAHPYEIKKWKRINISRNQIKDSIEELNKEMDNDKIPKEKRIFSLGMCYNDSNVDLEGHALKTRNNIFIDIVKGARKSGTDIKPDFSFKIPITNKRIIFSQIPDSEIKEYLIAICKDLLIFQEGIPYLDFAIVKNKGLYYYDLSIH